jgi:hypothetical protein
LDGAPPVLALASAAREVFDAGLATTVSPS